MADAQQDAQNAMAALTKPADDTEALDENQSDTPPNRTSQNE